MNARQFEVLPLELAEDPFQTKPGIKSEEKKRVMKKKTGLKRASHSMVQQFLFSWALFIAPFLGLGQNRETEEPAFIVVDSTTVSPLANVSVYLFNTTQHIVITAAITDDNGACYFKHDWLTDTGNVFLFNAVNYKELQIAVNAIAPSRYPIKVMLPKNTKILKEVTVLASRKIVNFNGNQMEFDIANVPNIKQMITSDVLDFLPFMRVDDNKVKLMNEPMVILINGKPHPFYNNPANLNSLPPAAIERIVVDMVAPSRFGAKVMNIILKKNYFLGWNGNFNASASSLTFSPTGQLSYWQNNLGVDVSVNFNTGASRYTRTSQLESFINKSAVNQEGKTTSNNMKGSLMASVFYNLDSLNSIDFQYTWSSTRIKEEAGYHIYFTDSFAQQHLQNSSIDKQDRGHASTFNLNYTKNLKKSGKQVYVLSQYTNSTGNNIYNLANHKVNFDSLLHEERFRDIQSTEESTLEAGFHNESTERLKYNAGAKIIQRRNTSDRLLSYLSVPAETFSGFFKYNQAVASAYLDANITIKKIVLHLGMRFDHEEFRYRQPIDLKRIYNGFFPSFAVTWNAGKFHVATATYSRNVSRPTLESLVPFSTVDNAYVRDSGSVNLQPQYENNYSLQLYGNYKFGRIGLDATYTATNDFIDSYYAGSSNGSIIRVDFNTSRYRSYVVGISAEIPITPKIRFSHFSSGAIVRQQGVGLKTKNLSGYISERLHWQLNKQYRISISATGNSPNFLLQGESQGRAYINTSVAYSYFIILFKKFPTGLTGSVLNPWYTKGLSGYSKTRDISFNYFTTSKMANPLIAIQVVINFKGKTYQHKDFRRTESIEYTDLKSK